MGQLRFRRPQHCAFCPRKPNSKEHAWPEWLLNFLKVDELTLLGDVEGHPALIDKTQKALRIKCVCIPCNTRWMKALEDTVKPIMAPMLRGEETRLDVLQQWTLARWAIKTSMVFEYVTHQRPLFYSDAERQTLAASPFGTLPANTAVWLARYLRGENGFALGVFGADGRTINPNPASFIPYTTTLVCGQLLIQVISIRADESERRTAIIHPKPGPWHEATLRIWPTKSVVAWPPIGAFTHTGLAYFHDHFNNPTMADGGWGSDDIITIAPR